MFGMGESCIYSAMVQLYVSDKYLLEFIIYPGNRMSFPELDPDQNILRLDAAPESQHYL